jgi:hypothetical protein
MCRWGFSNVVKTLKSVPDDRVRAYVVWLPIFGGNFKGAAQELSSTFPDNRVSYYLDPDSLTGNGWERVLKTEREMAWDVYFLYGPTARWEQEPPIPDFWMHQLSGVTKAPVLKEPQFTAKLKEMVSQMGTPNANRKVSGNSKVKVEFLYFQSCPSYKQTLENLKAALRDTHPKAELILINVDSPEKAEKAGFQGSPSIRINGEDLEGRTKARAIAAGSTGSTGSQP